MDEIPKTSVGKIDKKVLRSRYTPTAWSIRHAPGAPHSVREAPGAWWPGVLAGKLIEGCSYVGNCVSISGSAPLFTDALCLSQYPMHAAEIDPVGIRLFPAGMQPIKFLDCKDTQSQQLYAQSHP